MKTNTATPPTCSTSEAARVLGISVRAAQLWVENGLLQAWKTPGGHRRILCSSLERVVEQQNQAGDQGQATLSILIIEANADERENLKEALLAHFPASQINVSASAFDSLLRIGQQTPDILIADLGVVGLDASPTAEFTIGNAPLSGTLIIALAPEPSKLPAVRQRLPPEFTVLSKPVAIAELHSLIRAFIQGRLTSRRLA